MAYLIIFYIKNRFKISSFLSILKIMIIITKLLIVLMIMPLALASFSDNMDMEKMFAEFEATDLYALFRKIFGEETCPEIIKDARNFIEEIPQWRYLIEVIISEITKLMEKCEKRLGPHDEDVKQLFEYIKNKLQCFPPTGHRTNKWMKLNVKNLDALLDSKIDDEQNCTATIEVAREFLKELPDWRNLMNQEISEDTKKMEKCEQGLGPHDEDVRPLIEFITDSLECMNNRKQIGTTISAPAGSEMMKEMEEMAQNAHKWMIVAIVFIVAFILAFVGFLAMIVLRFMLK